MQEDVTFAQLRTFALAARASSFAQAAEQLDISQPSVSEQIKTLEDRLGCRLFRRRRGATSRLTPEGEQALEEVDRILAAKNNLFMLSRKPTAKVLLRICIGRYLRDNYIRQAMPGIYRKYPNVELDLQPLVPPAEITRQLEIGKFDMAVYSQPIDAKMQPYSRNVCETAMAMIAPAGTKARLAAGRCSLDDFQFIYPGPRDLAARNARQSLRDLGLAPSLPIMFVDFVETLAQLVEDGQGIGCTMNYAVADRIADGRVEVLDLPIPPLRRIVARSPHAPEEAAAIEDLLCDALLIRPRNARS